jgi:hypothetical protein
MPEVDAMNGANWCKILITMQVFFPLTNTSLRDNYNKKLGVMQVAVHGSPTSPMEISCKARWHWQAHKVSKCC